MAVQYLASAECLRGRGTGASDCMTPSMTGANKVASPALPPRLVPRPRLIAALNSGASGPLTLIAAGPGSGKTVLMSSWVNGRSARTAWLSLDAPDNHPSRFWPLVGEALFAAAIVDETDAF